MTTTERSFPVDEHVMFAVLTDPETYPAWLVGARRIRDVSPGWPAPGSEFRHIVGFGPVQIPDRTTSLSVDPPRSLELHVRARPAIEAKVRFDVEAHPDGCTVRMTETPVGIHKLLSPVAAPLVKARNARSLERLAEAISRRGSSAPA